MQDCIQQSDLIPYILTDQSIWSRFIQSSTRYDGEKHLRSRLTNRRHAKESDGDFLFKLSGLSEKQTCFHPGAVLFLHRCCCASDDFSGAAEKCAAV